MERDLCERRLVQIAGAIRDQLTRLKAYRLAGIGSQIEVFITNLDRLNAIRRKLSSCVAHQWTAAGNTLAGQAVRIVNEFACATGDLERAVDVFKAQVPPLREVFLEIRQAQEEFGELRYDSECETLSVVTKPIELDGIHLSEFEIQLHIPLLRELRHNEAYQVVALDPHPASCNEAVTHPHVSDERLCPGDAGAAICQALANGRICDFFLLVRSVLTHYNPDSPYVSLDNWYGRPCYDCGYSMGEDESYWCSSCENDFCEECASYCFRCDESFCRGCLQNCSVCEEHVCPACMTTCPDCSRPLCATCFEENQCPCKEEDEEAEDDAGNAEEGQDGGIDQEGPAGNEGIAASQTRPQVIAYSVGQASVLPRPR